MSDKKRDKSPFAGLLAEQLKSLELDLTDPEDASSSSADADPQSTRKSTRKSAPDHGARHRVNPQNGGLSTDHRDDPPLTDAELFAKSVEEMNPEDVYRGKYMGEGPALASTDEFGAPDHNQTDHGQTERSADSERLNHDQNPGKDAEKQLVDDEIAREQVARARDQLIFERAVGRVESVEGTQKYRRAHMHDPAEDAARRTAYRSDSPESLNTPPLPKSGDGLNQVGPLVAAQRELYERYKKRERQYEVAELNVRGDSVEDALRQVELFVHQQWKADGRYVRIIHGRGLHSDGSPVLKPAILHWLEGPGFRYVRGYVPEVNSAGDYGSLIVELERKSCTK